MLENGREKCSCRWVNCPRHGSCAECIEHHKGHKRYPQPSCKAKKPQAAPKKQKSEEEEQAV